MTTAVTTTLADFLLARLREDEKTARLCCSTDAPWIGLVDYQGAHYIGMSCARIRADVHAKRKVVRLHAGCGGGTGCPTLAYLALPYADHRDYDDGWRP
jgi:hypothetical protein